MGVSNVRAKATRARIPPESSSGRWEAKDPSPRLSRVASARVRASRFDAPARTRGSATLSRTRSQGASESDCGMRAQDADSLAFPWPVALSARSSPAAMRMRVLFPHPDGPTTAAIVPSSTMRSAPSNARTSPWEDR